MSKKSSPQSRPSRRPRSRTSGPQPARTAAGRAAGTQRSDRGRRASARAKKKDAKQQPTAPTTLGGRLRRYLPVVLIPNVVVVLGIVVVALAGLMLSSTTLTALPASVAQLWLVLNLVPVTGGAVELGVLPILPAIGLIAMIARRVHGAVKDRVSIADLAVLAACTLLVPVVLTLAAAAMMWDAGRVFAVGPPPLGDAVLRTLVVHLVGLVLGMGARLWRALLRRYGLPGWLVDAAGNAWRFLTWLAGAALLVLLVLLIAGWGRQGDLLAPYDGVDAVAALVAVSLLYLPNALIATSGVLLGSEFNFGEASVSLFSIHLVPLPPLPLLGVIPGTASEWAVVLLAVPAVLAAVLAYRGRPTGAQALAGGVLAAVIVFVACYLTRGVIGYYGPSGPMLWLTPALAFVWVAGAGLAVAVVGRIAELRSAAPEAEPEEQEAGEVPDGTEAAETSGQDEGTDEETDDDFDAPGDAEDPEDTENPEEAAAEDTHEDSGADAEPEAESVPAEDAPDAGPEADPVEEPVEAAAEDITEDGNEETAEDSPGEGGEEPGEAGNPDPRG
ncbi:DUF6350 family protein [Corynebacterium halotolerans]|uniref:cell division protein PerM n=1 Tax=Corynebacterium halotolerans TaxID=225326 RepID=UPI0005A9864A|nr:DUF6350 family protein [Corynebacterium halotolerans]